MKKRINQLLIIGIIAASAIGTAGCGKQNDDSDTSSEAGVKKITVAYRQDYPPYDYIDDDGKEQGYEVDVLKEIDKLLPDYEFEYVPTTDDDILIGVESGKYDIGTKGIWWTEERAKSYIYPEHYIGASIIGITFRAEDEGKIKDLESFAKYSGKLVPLAPQDARYTIVKNYNDNNPDNQVELIEADQFNNADAYQWVIEGRYDAYFDIKTTYEANVVSKDGEYHELADKLSYTEYEGIPVWPLINKENKEFADAYDKAWEELEKKGTFKELSEKHFGYNVFEYVPEGYEKGDKL